MPNVGDAGLYGRNAGTWKAADDVSGKRSGAWALASEVWALQAGTWQMVWQRNAAPEPVTALGVTYTGSGTGWTATATWTLPADTDLAAIKVRWTVAGVVGSWLTLGAAATSSAPLAVASGATVSVEVYAQDTGGLVSTTTTHVAPYAPLHAPGLTVTQVGLDTLQATWTHPAGSNRAGYTVTVSGGATGTWSDSASATTRTLVVTPGVATTVTVTAVDTLGRSGRTASTAQTANAPAPGTPTVSSWSYTSITLTWTAATWADGGYEVWRAVGAGAYALVASPAAGVTTYTGSVAEDTNYRYKVRAKGTTNTGNYSAEVRPAIGHAAYTTTDPWSDSATVNLYANSSGTGSLTGAGGLTVPANATVTQMSVSLATTFTTSVFCHWGSRDAYKVRNGVVDSAYILEKPNPWNETFAFSAGPGFAGVLLVGTGWSWSPTGGYRGTGTIGFSGTQVTSHPAVANGYW